MYIPKINQIKDHKKVFQFVHENSFGILVNFADDCPVATHIPMELIEKKDGQWAVYCHIAKANSHWKYFEKNRKSLCIFSSAHAYISPSWYNSVDVPTWNYMAVHLYGNARILDTPELKKLLEKQIDTYETGRKNPVKITDYQDGLIDKMMGGIVGIEIIIDDIQAKYKLSQNKSTQDFENVIHELEKSKNNQANIVANEMKKLKK